ncbi:MAG: methyl-accepting chemotaxis protein, partial [Candidatus Manganitrophaceae bacterium]
MMLDLFRTWNLRKKLLAWFLLVAMAPMVFMTAANLFFSAKNVRQGIGERLAANRKGVEIELQQEEKRLLNQAGRYAVQPLLVQTIVSGNREMIKRFLAQLLEFSESGLLGIYDERGSPISILQKGKVRSASAAPVPSKEEEAGFRFPSVHPPSAYADDDFTFDVPKSKKSDDRFSFDVEKGSPSPASPIDASAKEAMEGALSPELIRQIQSDGHAVVRSPVGNGIALSAYKTLYFSGKQIGFLRQGEILDQDFIEEVQQRVGLGVALVNAGGQKIISTLSDFDSIAADRGIQAPAKGKVGGEDYFYMVLPLIGKNGSVEGGIVLLQSLDSLSASQRQITLFSLILFGGVGMIVALVSLKMASSLTQPLRQIMKVLEYAEREGDLTRRIRVESKDEIGELARWFNSFAEKFSGIISQVKESTRSLAISSAELSSSSQQMGENSAETERLASTVSSASEQTNRNVQSVATAAEEMTATLKEISKSVLTATQITSQAVDVAQGTNR